MSALPDHPPPLTKTEYLALERSTTKHEFIQGDIYAMSGASEAHNLIAGSAYAALYAQLRRACKLYPSDMKVRTPATGTYVYPDETIVCGEALFADEQRDILLNPTVIIEVLAPSTERYDRGLKAQRYRELPKLQAYVLIAQDSPHIECFGR